MIDEFDSPDLPAVSRRVSRVVSRPVRPADRPVPLRRGLRRRRDSPVAQHLMSSASAVDDLDIDDLDIDDDSDAFVSRHVAAVFRAERFLRTFEAAVHVRRCISRSKPSATSEQDRSCRFVEILCYRHRRSCE